MLVGFGRVGRRFAKLIIEQYHVLEKKHSLRLEFVAIADSRGYVFGDELTASRVLDLTMLPRGGLAIAGRKGSLLDIIDRLDYDVLVNAAVSSYKDGQPGLAYAKAALQRGKAYVTADKPPLALALNQLEKQKIFYKATVMAGTPLIDLLRYGLLGRGVKRVIGILNGTSNYVLGLLENGLGLDEAIRRAQEEGYAEPNPSNDLHGVDLAAKAAIIAQTLGCNTTLRDVVIEDKITENTEKRVEELLRRGMRLKYVAVIDGCKAFVRLVDIGPDNPLYNVNGANNGVVIETGDESRIYLEGPGAGVDVTAWTLLSDVLLATKLVLARN